MNGLQRSVKSKSHAKSVAKGQMRGPSSMSSVAKMPQVSYPPRSNDCRHEPSPSRHTTNPTITASSALTKEENSQPISKRAASKHADTNIRLSSERVQIPKVNYPPRPHEENPELSSGGGKKQSTTTAANDFIKDEKIKPNSKQGVSKRADINTRLSSDNVKFPKVNYPPWPQEKKRELPTVKDTKRPRGPRLCPSAKNSDSRGITKLDHSHASPETHDTTPLKGQCKVARYRQTNYKPVANSNAYQSIRNNEGSLTMHLQKAGRSEQELKGAGNSRTMGTPEKKYNDSNVNLKMWIVKVSDLRKFVKPVWSFCIKNASSLTILFWRIILFCKSKFTFRTFFENNGRKCPDEVRFSARRHAEPLSTVGVKQHSRHVARTTDRTKSSHSQSENKDDIVNTSEMEALIDEMVNKQIIRNSDNPKRDIMNFFEKEVKMEKKDMDIALVHFRRVREKIVGLLNSEMNLGTWTFCNAGSHFDGTKVARPNEFDCTIFPELQTKLVAEFDGTSEAGACKVKVVGVVDDHETDLQLFLEGNYVNSERFKAYVFEKLECVLQTDRKLKDARKFKFTQSFAVRYEGIPTNEGMKSIDIDFVPSLNITPWPPKNIVRDITKVIPKQSKATAVQKKGFKVTAKHWFHAKDPHLLWQVSFSYAEKIITKYADKVCWKPSLRTLKRVLEIVKCNSDSYAKSNSPELLQIQKAVKYVKDRMPELRIRSLKLTTYHIRTFMWWRLYELTVGPHVWGAETMATRFQECLREFQKMMTGKVVVPHFFLPEIKDILPHRLGKEREFLYVIARATEVIFTKKK